MSEGGQVLARGDQGWREQLPDTTTVLLSAEWNVDGESYPPPVSRVQRDHGLAVLVNGGIPGCQRRDPGDLDQADGLDDAVSELRSGGTPAG
jgi:hypothetical protein